MQATMLLYRSMKKNPNDGLPVVSDSSSGLGIRLNTLVNQIEDNKIDKKFDIDVNEDGKVIHSAKGLSVTPNDPYKIPVTLRPKSYKGGSPNRYIFEIPTNKIGTNLAYVPDPKNPLDHGFLAPSEEMLASDYRDAIIGTRPDWTEK